MKLLVLSDAGSVHTERWVRWFEKAGWETGLFSLEPARDWKPGRFWQGQRQTTVGVIDYWLARKQLSAILDEFKPDIISAHYVVSYGWLAVQDKRCPVVCTAWGSDLLLLPQRSILHRKRIASALKKSDLVTVDNGNLFNAALEYISESKIRRVILGVNRDVIDSGYKRDFSGEGKLRIIAPRGLQAVYDPMTIINAVELARDRIDMVVDMCGEGSRAYEIEEEIRRRELGDIIKIIPRRPHDEYIASLTEYDIYLSASVSDSTSVALMEAMAIGLYPVVTDIAGNQEWITPGETGSLFAPGSPSKLSEALVDASEKRSQFMEIAQLNRARIETEAVWDDNASRLEKDFMQLMGD